MSPALRVALPAACVLSLLACLGGTSEPEPEDDGDRPPLALKPVDPRQDPAILPGKSFEPPVPEVAITSEECEDVEPLGPPEDGCVTAKLACDDVIVGHTDGGFANNRFDTRFYERHHCTPATTHHDRTSERLYRLDMPQGDWRAFVTLDTPCADLDLAAAKSRVSCLDGGSNLAQCEMSVWDEDRERVELVSRHATTWWIIVEGKDGRDATDAPFALTVQCVPGLVGGPD